MTSTNMSHWDRIIRVIVIAFIGLLLLTGQISGWFAVLGGFIVFVFTVSSLTSFCPLYVPFRINTARRSRRPAA